MQAHLAIRAAPRGSQCVKEGMAEIKGLGRKYGGVRMYTSNQQVVGTNPA